MSEYVFSCRIDGRAGYVRLWSDALELLRSGRRTSTEPEFVWLNSVTTVTTARPGRLFTAVQVVADSAALNLTFPAADAPRVAELIQALVAAQVEPAPVEPPRTVFSLPPEPPAAEAPAAEVPAAEVPAVEVSAVEVSTVEVPEFELPDFAVPDFSIIAPEMPEWTPLPESDRPDPVVAAAVTVADQPDPASAPASEWQRPADLPEETEKRLSRLEVLRSCGIMTDTDFAEAEAGILESAWSAARSG